MKNAIRYSSIFFALAIVLFAAGTRETAAQGVLSRILERMEAHNKALQTVQAGVTMAKFNPQLGTTDTYNGRTSVLTQTKGKRYMRLDWAQPAVEQISIIGDEYQLYKPGINQVYTGRVDKSKNSAGAGNALAFMSMSRAQLKANYTVVYLGDEVVSGNGMTWHLQLTPKVAASYKSAELWVNTDGMPVQGKVLEQNNDTTTVTLTGIQKNVPINTNIFKLNPPRSAKVIKA
jgi:outer membrane lipoprotein-sorting protein